MVSTGRRSQHRAATDTARGRDTSGNRAARPPTIPGLSEEFLDDLHPFDGTPTTGVGHLALLRLTGASGAKVWFNANPYEPHRMDLDCPTYLETVRITKGTFSWQYLFVAPSEVDLSSEEFESAGERLTSMLEVFPRIFPDHDYSDLRARLEARL